MLPKSHRLDAEGHKRLAQAGKRYFSDNLVLKVADSKENYNIFSVVVSKKIEKKAVLRNSARRRIYAIIRNFYKEISGSGIYIVSTKKPIKDIMYADLKKEIDFLFKKAKI